jgi:flagellar basal-body rod modification protein FlgD
MSLTQGIDSLLKSSVPYSVTSSLLDGNFGVANYQGDMSGDLWKPTNEMGKDQFLHLLCVQLKYQDPLSPMDNTAFVSQLAQFRALETGENTERAIRGLEAVFNESLAAQMYSAQSVANSSAMSLIGREVRMLQPTLAWDGRPDSRVPINVHLGNFENASVEIRNADGEVIRTIAVNSKDAQNSAVVHWDGRMDNGQTARAGTYRVSVQGSERNPSLYTFVQDVVEGVRFTADGVLVKIGGREISIAEVLDVSRDEEAYFTQSNALSMMGRVVRARFDSFRHSATEGAEHSIMVQGQAGQQVNVEIKNSAGTVVTTLRGVADDSGRAQFFWDGYNSEGRMAPAGEYRINVVGSDTNPGIYSYTEGVVDGLTSLTGDFKLRVGSAEVSISDVISISTPRS